MQLLLSCKARENSIIRIKVLDILIYGLHYD